MRFPLYGISDQEIARLEEQLADQLLARTRTGTFAVLP